MKNNTLDNTLVAPNTPKKRNNTPKKLFCPHCEKPAYLRKFVDTEGFFLWALNRIQEHQATQRLTQEDYEYFRETRIYIKRVNWLSSVLGQFKRRDQDER